MNLTNKTKPVGNIEYFCGIMAGSPMSCYVIHGESSDMLIDTGMSVIRRELDKWVGQFNISHIFLTHAHMDHDGNAAYLHRRLGAKIILSKADSSLIGNFGSQKMCATMRKYKLRTVQQNVFGVMPMFRSDIYTPDIVIAESDTDRLRAFGFDADIVPLAGHTLGSLGILSGDVLYCGDAFTAIWGKPDVTPHATSVLKMRESIERILDIPCKWLATGHGLPIDADEAKKVIENYLKMLNP
ncbi:MAG: MBL fold metallo-hydrolase [Ruminococcus sp.]|nr:MBL fold metallo-hydrolase [Ruminococcus sp.]